LKLLTSSQPKEQIVQGWATADMSDMSQVFWVDDILWVLKGVQGHSRGENANDSNRVIFLNGHGAFLPTFGVDRTPVPVSCLPVASWNCSAGSRFFHN